MVPAGGKPYDASSPLNANIWWNDWPFSRLVTGPGDVGPGQFFINYAETPHLNGQYTVWGQVVEGLEHIDQLAKGEPPTNPDKIVKMQVAADAKQ